MQKSIDDTRDAPAGVIERRSRAMDIEGFFQGVEVRAASLGSDEKAAVFERLALTRESPGSNDLLEFS